MNKRITIEYDERKIIIEDQRLVAADEWLDAFKRALVGLTFPASVLDDEEGYWEWHERKEDD